MRLPENPFAVFKAKVKKIVPPKNGGETIVFVKIIDPKAEGVKFNGDISFSLDQESVWQSLKCIEVGAIVYVSELWQPEKGRKWRANWAAQENAWLQHHPVDSVSEEGKHFHEAELIFGDEKKGKIIIVKVTDDNSSYNGCEIILKKKYWKGSDKDWERLALNLKEASGSFIGPNHPIYLANIKKTGRVYEHLIAEWAGFEKQKNDELRKLLSNLDIDHTNLKSMVLSSVGLSVFVCSIVASIAVLIAIGATHFSLEKSMDLYTLGQWVRKFEREVLTLNEEVAKLEIEVPRYNTRLESNDEACINYAIDLQRKLHLKRAERNWKIARVHDALKDINFQYSFLKGSQSYPNSLKSRELWPVITFQPFTPEATVPQEEDSQQKASTE